MATVDADPGEDAEVTVLVFNTGTAAEAFELQVVGPCSPWAFLDPAVVRLDAGDFSEARLVLRPPRIADVPAGPHPFGVRLTARTDPRVDEVAEGAVDVSPYEAFSARLVPEEVAASAKARVRVEVQNDGNCPLVTRLEAADNDGHASFKWDDDTLFVPPGTALAAWLTVRPRHRRLLSTKHATRYSVRIESASRVATLAGRIRARGALGSFALRAAIALARARRALSRRADDPDRRRRDPEDEEGAACRPASKHDPRSDHRLGGRRRARGTAGERHHCARDRRRPAEHRPPRRRAARPDRSPLPRPTFADRRTR